MKFNYAILNKVLVQLLTKTCNNFSTYLQIKLYVIMKMKEFIKNFGRGEHSLLILICTRSYNISECVHSKV